MSGLEVGRFDGKGDKNMARCSTVYGGISFHVFSIYSIEYR